jgi:DNA (cytosine-5)-methyltransferase 1
MLRPLLGSSSKRADNREASLLLEEVGCDIISRPAELHRDRGRPVSRLRLLDLFCGAGGASAGYYRAGFEVTGVDLARKQLPDGTWVDDAAMPKRYPFEFIKADALEMLADREFVARFDVIHASPPCQRYSLASKYNGREYPDFIPPTRSLLKATGLPWVIENVPGAPLRPDFVLCGCMFGLGLPEHDLQLRRERWFETSWRPLGLVQPHQHWGYSISIAGHGTPSWVRRNTGHIGIALWRQVMGIDWMTRGQLTEALPPAYTEYVGTILRKRLEEDSPDAAWWGDNVLSSGRLFSAGAQS